MSVRGGAPLGGGTIPAVVHSSTPSLVPAGEAWYAGGDFLNAGNVTPPVDVIRIVPFLPRRTGTLDRIGVNHTVNGAAGSVMRVGAYAANPLSPFQPTTRLFGSAPIAMDAGAGAIKSAVCAVPVVEQHLIWLVLLSGVNTFQVTVAVGAGNPTSLFYGFSAAFAQQAALTAAFAFAALPATFPAPNGFLTIALTPIILARYAS